ncbi:1-alkyl-2-acetylglycerophosphocholine esterase [Fusarium beomiforme]|uniref:1-alkyl-2-acetylglycerophosphocholine esterase n=1 Tax=Fusarium beomiforme TaxID=44412 RepID=A0A9P5DSE9_9HYPO|nr:1-alkyl-2-acetylglycerophosphocholine esterase [Fusarium beomiforme]
MAQSDPWELSQASDFNNVILIRLLGLFNNMSKDSTAIKQSNGFAIDVSIIPGNQDGGVAVPWSRCYDSLRTADDSNPDIRSGQNHVIEIAASAVTIKFRRGEYDGRPNTWIGTVCAGDGVWQGEFFLTTTALAEIIYQKKDAKPILSTH